MCDGGDVIDNNVNDDAINDDGFVDSISTGNINDDEDISDDLAVANTFEKGDVGGNAAAVDTDDNDGFTNNVAADNTTEDWVVGNNPGNDNTGDEDGFVNNFAVDDTTDDKVVCDNATDDANDDKDVGVNVVAFDTVDDEYFSENVTSVVTNIASFGNTADDNHGQKKNNNRENVIRLKLRLACRLSFKLKTSTLIQNRLINTFYLKTENMMNEITKIQSTKLFTREYLFSKEWALAAIIETILTNNLGKRTMNALPFAQRPDTLVQKASDVSATD